MDAEEAEGSLKLLLILLALFLFSMVKSCNEVRFLAVGKTVTTEIDRFWRPAAQKGGTWDTISSMRSTMKTQTSA